MYILHAHVLCPFTYHVTNWVLVRVLVSPTGYFCLTMYILYAHFPCPFVSIYSGNCSCCSSLPVCMLCHSWQLLCLRFHVVTTLIQFHEPRVLLSGAIQVHTRDRLHMAFAPRCIHTLDAHCCGCSPSPGATLCTPSFMRQA